VAGWVVVLIARPSLGFRSHYGRKSVDASSFLF
jgi:hypothetical protein